ncbi:hypothetical protein [Actinomyces qiguomingii]|uniref:hypothetical protein n=1 Tax=Actinomyces qiguomingii TaxID=2057800 RepID=UPI003A0FBF66
MSPPRHDDAIGIEAAEVLAKRGITTTVGDATVSTDPITGVRRPIPLAGPANRAGRLVADFIMDPEHARPIPAPLGTAIVRAGEMTAAVTGADRAGLGVADLIYLDLAYAPPFGQAKDPVNLVGMLGANVLNGTVEVWDVRDLEQVRRTQLAALPRPRRRARLVSRASGFLRGLFGRR